MESKACNHRWVVFSTALADGCLMLECELCGMRSTVDNPTEEEWNAAFYAPSNPYIWEGGDERVNVLKEPNASN